MAEPEDSHPDANYVLQATDVERKRLEMQHKLMMALFPNGIFPKDLELRKGDKILDSGTGAWAVEAASVVPSGVHVYAVDIEQLLWPVHPPANTIFSVHSVQSLPSDWSSTFSFVHQRLLGGGLDLLGWQRALSEALRVLKPGGFIRIVDIRNLHLYVHLPDRVDASLRIPYTKRHQELMTLLWDSRNLLQNCGERLPTLVQEAGFEIVEVEPATISYGPLGRGSAWREDLSALLRSMKFPILQAKGFGLIHSEEEYDELIRNIELEWDENVMMLDFVAVTGRKPVGLEAP